MASRARDRLNSAEKLLRLAESHSADSDLFRPLFEAFIALGRSVIHVLEREAKKAGGWTCFEPEWKRLGTEQLPEFFRRSRNLLLKEGVKGDSRTRKVATEIVTSGLRVSDSAKVEIVRAGGEMEAWAGGGQGVRMTDILFPPEHATGKPADKAQGSTEHFFARGPYKDQEVFMVCRQYLARLLAAIVEAETAYLRTNDASSSVPNSRASLET